MGMPLKQGYEDDMGWYRWGKTGKKYYYTPGDEKSRVRARNKAVKQGRAIESI